MTRPCSMSSSTRVRVDRRARGSPTAPDDARPDPLERGTARLTSGPKTSWRVPRIMAYAVVQWTREFGIRLALGATAGDVRAWLLGTTVALCCAGLALGVVGRPHSAAFLPGRCSEWGRSMR